jgi:hypothetical protein
MFGKVYTAIINESPIKVVRTYCRNRKELELCCGSGRFFAKSGSDFKEHSHEKVCEIIPFNNGFGPN